MHFLEDVVVPHLDDNEKDGKAIERDLDSRHQVQGAEEEVASFYLKLLCNKKSEWMEIQVIELGKKNREPDPLHLFRKRS